MIQDLKTQLLSISDTSTNGGKIGWVKSSNLSEFIKNQIYNLKEGIFLNQ